jgi:hypothetical protein
MTVTARKNSTFELCTCCHSMISRPTTFLWLEHSHNFEMSDMWYRHKLFSPYSG